MSIHNVELFFEQVKKNEVLSEKYNDLIKKHNEEIMHLMVELGSDAGYTFTIEDVKDFERNIIQKLLEDDEIVDEHLAAVAGGVKLELIDGEYKEESNFIRDFLNFFIWS